MNRKTFLATITALFTAPFIGKSKEQASKAEFEAWVKANPAIMEAILKNAIKRGLEERLPTIVKVKEYNISPCLELSEQRLKRLS